MLTHFVRVLSAVVTLSLGHAGLSQTEAAGDSNASQDRMAESNAAQRALVEVGPAPATVAGRSLALVGRVLDRPGGKPVAGAKVGIYSGWQHSGLPVRPAVTVQTDAEGAYSFVPAVPGPYRICLVDRPPGVWTEGVVVFITDEPDRHPPGKTDMIRTNQNQWELAEVKDLPPGKRVEPGSVVEATVVVPGRTESLPDLHLALPQRISGTVRDKADRPAGGAKITFLSAAMCSEEVCTDANGQYRIYTPPRSVSLRCQGTDDRYYPSEQVYDRVVSVGAGEETDGTDFKVVSATAITGQVVIGDWGKVPAGTDVWVQTFWRDNREWGGIKHLNFALSTGVKTDANGNFTTYLRNPHCVDIVEGVELESVTAWAWSPDGRLGGMASLSGQKLSDPRARLCISLSHVGSAIVTVVGPDDQAVTGAKVFATTTRTTSFVPKGMPTLKSEEIGQGRYCIEGLIPNMEFLCFVKADGFQVDYPGNHKPIIAESARQIHAPQIKLEWAGGKDLPRLMKIADRDQGAVYALGQLGSQAAPAVPTLIAILRASPDKESRRRAAQALGRIGQAAKGTMGELVSAMEKDDKEVAQYAAEALGLIGDPQAVGAIKSARQSARLSERTAAVALWRIRLAAGTQAPSTGPALPPVAAPAVQEAPPQATQPAPVGAAQSKEDPVDALVKAGRI